MDGSRLSPFPNYSWFGLTHDVGPAPVPAEFHLRQVNQLAVLILSGRSSNRWIHGGRETPFSTVCGDVGFFAADNEEHTISVSSDTGVKAFILAIPRAHLQSIAAAEGLEARSEMPALPVFQDAIIRDSLSRLVVSTPEGYMESGLEAEAVARSLVVRLTEVIWEEKPDWHADSSTFDSRMVGRIKDHIDAHLHHYIPLADLARLFGMSPSHFAKKFRNSTGLSLQRFVNRRRLQASMTLLRADSKKLSQIALDLGFSSQSHFTRLFSELTGFTPASFRRQICRA